MFRMIRYLRPYWWQSILLVAAVGIQAWGTLQLPTMMSMIVNNGIMGNSGAGNYGVILQIGLLMIGVALISTAGALVSGYLSARIGAAVGRDIRNEFFAKVLSFSINEIDDFSTASLITRTTNDIATVQQTLIMMLSMMLRAPLMAIGAIFQAIALAPNMTWIIALAVGIMLALTITILVMVIPKFELYQKFQDKINLQTRESLTGLMVIRAFNNQRYEENKFSKTNEDLRRLDVFASSLLGLQSPLMMLIFNGTAILCIWIGISNLEFDASYLGKMMAFMQYATQTIMSFMFLTVIFVILPRASVSARRVEQVLKTKASIRWKEKMVAAETEIPEVEFKHVNFAYGSAEAEVLHDISFKATAGKTTAFIGSTGSGKTTLVNLITRFYDVTAGEVLVDGVNVKEYTEDALMKKIGLVPQRAFLFSGTVRSNILFGVDRSASREEGDERMKKAAEIAQAKEFVEKLPEKYEAPISEGGTNVSGGQRQRLSIARAVAKQPEIYIFDDAFSALDMKTDKKLREALRPVTKKAVTLIVAQRISTIKDADQIIVLDEGKMVGCGTHLELLRDCEVYREITKSQLSDKEYQAEIKAAGKGKK